MARQDFVKKLVSTHQRRLQILETTRLTNGPDTPESVLIEIDDIKSKISSLQEELEEFEQGKAKILPPEIEGSYYQTKEALSELRQILNDLSTEISYVSIKAQAKAAHLLEEARQRFSELEEEWQALELQLESAENVFRILERPQSFLKRLQSLFGLKVRIHPSPEETLRNLRSNLASVKATLHTLILRHTLQRRFGLLQEKLTKQQLILTEEQLQTTLQPQLHYIEEQIQSLEGKETLTPQEERLLTLYRRNLELSQQMFTRKRPYAPLNLWIEIIEVEQKLEEVDNKLIEL